MNYNVIGLMSGTSLDGLDAAWCKFSFAQSRWKYKIIAAKTYPYTKEWREKLSTVENKPAEELAKLHSEYGHFTGRLAKRFISEFNVAADFVSSHGHTIFHQPELPLPFTFQLGCGAAIAAECGLPVVCDFRTTDVALGGQGAPLVPIGDKWLFPEFDFCLNIGGIANVSMREMGERSKKKEKRKKNEGNISVLAYDICPAKIVLNFLAQDRGKEFDRNGEIARAGKVNEKLLKELNALKYYSLKSPKTLGKEWVVNEFFPVLQKYNISVEDKLRTVAEHIAIQIVHAVKSQDTRTKSHDQNSNYRQPISMRYPVSGILITGGGAHNKFLIERVNLMLPACCQSTIPNKLTVDFKEALIFAFLGVLRWRGENNCLASVTGADRDNCGGAIYAHFTK